jgi:cbb3-type cytochrome oxidase subunit 3
MKRAGIITTALLLFFLATMASAYAQHEQEGKEHEKSPQAQEQQKAQPAQHQHQAKEQSKPQQGQSHQQRPAAPPRQQAKQPAQQRHEAQPQHQAKPQRQAQRQQPVQHQARPQESHNGARPNGQPHGATHASVRHNDSPQHQQQARRGFVQARARSWDHDHRTWGQRGGYHGYRVPQDRFSLYFGSSHDFRIYSLPFVFVSGHPRFQYNNYQVTFVDPWPETWPEDWYQTDDTYLDYNGDGYYLYNRSRPGPAIAVSIAL